jgi:hypothetical protein
MKEIKEKLLVKMGWMIGDRKRILLWGAFIGKPGNVL